MKKMAVKSCTDKKAPSGAYATGLKGTLSVEPMMFYGASGMAEGSPNCLASSVVSPLVMSVFSTVVGLRSLSFAVRMIVIKIETFFLPFSERVPKVSFRNITQHLSPVSAMLFVGLISSGKLRKVKISFLCFLSLFLRVSHSLRDRGGRYNFLKDFKSGTHLIIAQKVKNVSISGPGCIDGNCLAFFESGETGGKLKIKGKVRTSQMVIFCDCENVKVSDVLFTNSPYWHLFIYGCRNVHVHGIRIKSHPDTHTNDGLDIDSSVNVLVSDCMIESQDDCITLRANNAALESRQNCENISVTNCILKTDCCGIRVGVGDGEIRNAVISNIVIKNAGVGIDIIGRYTDTTAGVLIENILFSNFMIYSNAPFFISPGYGNLKTMRNISFRNITAFAQSCSYIGGLQDNKSREISMRDVKIIIRPGVDNIPERNDLISEWRKQNYTAGSTSKRVPYGFWLEHILACEFKDIQIIMEDIDDAWLNAVRINDVEKLRFESIVLKGFDDICRDGLLSHERTDDFTLETFNNKNISEE